MKPIKHNILIFFWKSKIYVPHSFWLSEIFDFLSNIAVKGNFMDCSIISPALAFDETSRYWSVQKSS